MFSSEDRRDARVGVRPRRRLSGFLYRSTKAGTWCRGAPYEHALVVGADVMSSIIDYTDRTTCVLFGDGAGAVVCRRRGEGEPRSWCYDHYIDGSGGGMALCMPGGGSRMPASHETVDQRMHYVKQDGPGGFQVRREEER